MPQVVHLPNNARVVFYGKEMTERMESTYKKRVREAATLLLRRIRGKVSRNYPPASAPGEWPRRRSGKMGQGYYVVFADNGLSFRLKNDTPQAGWTEFGTKGGKMIYAKPGGWLSWVGPDGRRHFAKKVRQGAIKPRKGLRALMVESRNDLERIWKTRITGTVRIG